MDLFSQLFFQLNITLFQVVMFLPNNNSRTTFMTQELLRMHEELRNIVLQKLGTYFRDSQLESDKPMN